MPGAHHFVRRDHYVKGNLNPHADDITTPKFADHDGHVAAVMAAGGFCAFSEQRWGKGKTAVCLPLLWPAPAATVLAEVA